MTTATLNATRWPERYLPAKSAVFVRNDIEIAAPPEHVWAWLLRAQLWPEWYANSADIHFLSHTGPDRRDRSRFRWRTFGVRITSKVLEFDPCARLAWDAHGIGVSAYHTWTLTRKPDGATHVLTEETQNGWLARLSKRLMPTRLHDRHQEWLEGLAAKAESGPPPEVGVAGEHEVAG
jgi:uncharacterized protein YndB with AHSA1/START domain